MMCTTLSSLGLGRQNQTTADLASLGQHKYFGVLVLLLDVQNARPAGTLAYLFAQRRQILVGITARLIELIVPDVDLLQVAQKVTCLCLGVPRGQPEQCAVQIHFSFVGRLGGQGVEFQVQFLCGRYAAPTSCRRARRLRRVSWCTFLTHSIRWG